MVRMKRGESLMADGRMRVVDRVAVGKWVCGYEFVDLFIDSFWKLKF